VTYEKLPTCQECGNLLPDDKTKRAFCHDCENALAEMAEVQYDYPPEDEDDE
jgi:hypothetical protein